jgi:hypothetical protein
MAFDADGCRVGGGKVCGLSFICGGESDWQNSCGNNDRVMTLESRTAVAKEEGSALLFAMRKEPPPSVRCSGSSQ